MDDSAKRLPLEMLRQAQLAAEETCATFDRVTAILAAVGAKLDPGSQEALLVGAAEQLMLYSHGHSTVRQYMRKAVTDCRMPIAYPETVRADGFAN